MNQPKFIPVNQLKQGTIFTVHAKPDAYQQGVVAQGRIFRIREVAFPFVFADHYVGPNRWIDSPWMLNLEQGINLIELTPAALFRGKIKEIKRKHKK